MHREDCETPLGVEEFLVAIRCDGHGGPRRNRIHSRLERVAGGANHKEKIRVGADVPMDSRFRGNDGGVVGGMKAS